MSEYTYPISVSFEHRVCFTHQAFALDNLTFASLFSPEQGAARLLFLVEEVIDVLYGDLRTQAEEYSRVHCPFLEQRGWVSVLGGEESKNGEEGLLFLIKLLQQAGMDRHSYVVAIGGGAFLDVVGLATSLVHRGVRLVRMPTTVLSQDDSGVGVKNGMNAFGQKNFLGAFAVPYAVLMDLDFLASQPLESQREGLIEAIKVALVKDRVFYEWIEAHAQELSKGEKTALEYAVERSAVLHLCHIAEGGDPFEWGSSRPLDFGHWAAHKLELLSGFEISHARAVCLGLSLDMVYSALSGLLEAEQALRFLALLDTLGLPTWDELMEERNEAGELLLKEGMEEFRQHLGGQLTLLLLRAAGESVEVHELDFAILQEALDFLKTRVIE